VYRNPYSILDPTAIDTGMGSKNGSVNSFSSYIPSSQEPRLRYNHMATLAHLPNGSIIAQWQVSSSRRRRPLPGLGVKLRPVCSIDRSQTGSA
jgi:hypothetical protein